MMGVLCAFYVLSGCKPAAEVPTAGDGPKQSASEAKKPEAESDSKAAQEEDDTPEGGSYLE